MYVHDNKTNISNDVTENPLNEWGFQGVTKELQGVSNGFLGISYRFQGVSKGFQMVTMLMD